MKNKPVSIIVISYNCEKYISQCIKSLLESDYPDFEIIVIDNASTDNTKKELKLRDMIVVGVLLGIATTIRFQTFVVLITFIIFLFLRSRKIRQNFFFAIIVLLVFDAGEY